MLWLTAVNGVVARRACIVDILLQVVYREKVFGCVPSLLLNKGRTLPYKIWVLPWDQLESSLYNHTSNLLKVLLPHDSLFLPASPGPLPQQVLG